jgi:hypothetical protein
MTLNPGWRLSLKSICITLITLLLGLLTGIKSAALADAPTDSPFLIYHFAVSGAQPPAKVTPWIGTQPQAIKATASMPGLLLAINGGYFDPKNGQTASWVLINGQTMVDPNTNARLAQNPALQIYWHQILNRGELRVYQCTPAASSNPTHPSGKVTRLDITRHRDPIPAGCQLQHSLGAGPILYPNPDFTDEAFVAQSPSGKTTRDPLSINQARARSAVGLTDNGDLVVVMAKHFGPQRLPGPNGALSTTIPANGGATLVQLAEVLRQAGAVKALNLDGGSSSQVLVRNDQGQLHVIPGEVDGLGRSGARKVLSVLVVQSNTLQQPLALNPQKK